MLANIKFKALEDLKMIRADSSDALLQKWLKLEKKKRMKIRQADDDMIYQEKFNVSAMRAEENPELITALNNVLTLVSEKKIKSLPAETIKAIKEFLYNCQRDV